MNPVKKPLPKFGTKFMAMLAMAGIDNFAQLEALGAVGAFLQVRAAGSKPTLNLLYALHGALTGRHWRAIPESDKQELIGEVEFMGEVLELPEAQTKKRHPDYEKIYAVVKKIPKGKVATYGQIAQLAGLPGRARQVGYALNKTPTGRTLPWQRVVNAQGKVSLGGRGKGEQQRLLEDEGIEFDRQGRIALKRYQWQPG
jgi:methylated-DNA-protein-cysteine methyltransferase-like protein